MAEDPSREWSKIFKVVAFSAICVLAAFIVTGILVLRRAEWHPQLVRFTSRVWATFIGYNAGSTSPGFINSILLSVLALVIVVLYIASVRGLEAMKNHIIETAAMGVLAVSTAVLIVYGTQFGWQVARASYQDHQVLAAKVVSLKGKESLMVYPSERDATIGDLRRRLRESQSQLASRKQMIIYGDPAFYNMQKILEAFSSYRYALKGQRCYIYITYPPQSAAIGMIFASLSNSVSGCSTFGSQGRENPDADEEVRDGMKPGVLLLHAPRGDTGAGHIEEALSGVIPLERSYKPLSAAFPHYQGQTAKDSALWLQFGPDMHWNSEGIRKVNR